MNDFLLYGNRESGHSYKIKLALQVANVPHRYEEIDIWMPREERPEPFRSLARYGEVPLLIHDGQALVQSDAILCYLAEYLHAFGAESATRMNRVREWLFWEANRIGLALPQLRYGRKFAPTDYPAGALQWIEQRFHTDLARLEHELSDGRQFILDDHPTVADFSLCGYMFWPEQAQVTYPEHVEAWLARIRALPGWQHPYDMK